MDAITKALALASNELVIRIAAGILLADMVRLVVIWIWGKLNAP